MDDIKVSVLCIAYNHEKYIRQCLDSIVSQKTDFKFEVLVHDDASTDKTADIIREYEKKYPGIIKPIYQKENQTSKGIGITGYILLPLAIGEYIAYCECDDFWCDDNKLQKQVNILENNENLDICINGVGSVREDGTPFGALLPSYSMDEGIVDAARILEIGEEFQLSGTMFSKKSLSEYYLNRPSYCKASTGAGDVLLYFYYLANYDVFYSPEVLSVHRSASIGSWSSRQANLSKEKKTEYFNKRVELFELYDEYTKGEFSEVMKKVIDIEYAYIDALNGKLLFIRCFFKYDLTKVKKKDLIYMYLKARFPHILTFIKKVKG